MMTQTALDDRSARSHPKTHGARDPDASLVEALAEGAPNALERLVRTYGGRVHRLALRITGCREDAEEAAQDALWNATRKIGTFRGGSAFGSWLYRVTANAAWQAVRSRRSSTAPFAVLKDWHPHVEIAPDHELRDRLRTAIGELAPRYRAVFVLRDVEGLAVAEIAESLGLSSAAVRLRAHRARLFLRRRLAAYAR